MYNVFVIVIHFQLVILISEVNCESKTKSKSKLK